MLLNTITEDLSLTSSEKHDHTQMHVDMFDMVPPEQKKTPDGD